MARTVGVGVTVGHDGYVIRVRMTAAVKSGETLLAAVDLASAHPVWLAVLLIPLSVALITWPIAWGLAMVVAATA